MAPQEGPDRILRDSRHGNCASREPPGDGYTNCVIQSLRRFWWLLRRSLILAFEDNCFGIAKAGAYSALLSLFPLLTATATILVQIRAQPITRILSRALSYALPPGTEGLVLNHFRMHGERPSGLIGAATLISIWAASRVVTSLMEGFQAAYHIPVDRPFFRQQGIAILLVFASSIPVVAASALILFGTRSEQAVLYWLGLVPAGAGLRAWVALAASAARFGIALGTMVLVHAVLYKLGPNRPQRWRTLWPGASVSTVLRLASTLGFASYVLNIANYNLLYGSLGAVIALLVWMYVLVAISLIGCEFNAEYERMLQAEEPEF